MSHTAKTAHERRPSLLHQTMQQYPLPTRQRSFNDGRQRRLCAAAMLLNANLLSGCGSPSTAAHATPTPHHPLWAIAPPRHRTPPPLRSLYKNQSRQDHAKTAGTWLRSTMRRERCWCRCQAEPGPEGRAQCCAQNSSQATGVCPSDLVPCLPCR
jgi:hypothetical protein